MYVTDQSYINWLVKQAYAVSIQERISVFLDTNRSIQARIAAKIAIQNSLHAITDDDLKTVIKALKVKRHQTIHDLHFIRLNLLEQACAIRDARW